MTTTYFQFRGKIYQQKFGTAMGSPVSGISGTESQRQRPSWCQTQAVAPLCRRHSGNNTSWPSREPHRTLEHYGPHGSIQFTHEQEVGGKIPFLDTLIVRKPDGSVKNLIYRKATHTDQYLNFSSHHPVHQKLGVVHTLFDRMNTIISEKDDIKSEEQTIKNAHSLCGYPKWAFTKVQDKMANKTVKNNKSAKKIRITNLRALSSFLMYKVYRREPPGFSATMVLPRPWNPTTLFDVCWCILRTNAKL